MAEHFAFGISVPFFSNCAQLTVSHAWTSGFMWELLLLLGMLVPTRSVQVRTSRCES